MHSGVPYALGIDPGLRKLYLSYAPEGDNPREVRAYNISTGGLGHSMTVAVGTGGSDGGGGVVANPQTHHVFVSNSVDDNVTVFDGVTGMVLATVAVGDDPQFIGVDPGLSYVYVSNRKSNTVSGIPDKY
jgi:YVTN family beta-propeller protein